MRMRHLGQSFDIHTGGVDLIFPHHEDEIAQSEAATGKPFVRTWLHCAHLQMSGAKMAKSTGNIARVGELLEAGVVAARAALRADRGPLPGEPQLQPTTRWRRPRPRSSGSTRSSPRSPRTARTGRTTRRCPTLLAAARTAFDAALDDDLNVSAALAAVFDLVRELNRRIDGRTLSTADAGRGNRVAPRDSTRSWASCRTRPTTLEPELRALLDARVAARAARDWAASDRLRDELAARGIAVEDTRDGQRWRRLVEAGRG